MWRFIEWSTDIRILREYLIEVSIAIAIKILMTKYRKVIVNGS